MYTSEHIKHGLKPDKKKIKQRQVRQLCSPKNTCTKNCDFNTVHETNRCPILLKRYLQYILFKAPGAHLPQWINR